MCEVRGEAVFPVLEVSDMRSSGSAERLSKLQLWSLFSLDALNAHLSRDPAPSELTYRLPTRHRSALRTSDQRPSTHVTVWGSDG